MKLRLTDIAIKRLSAPDQGQVTYWDDANPGFGLRCSTKSKSFVVMYGEKRRLKTLGRYPEFSLSDARKVARRFLAESDDLPEANGPAPILFEEAKQRFLAHCMSRNKERTVKDYTRLLNRHFELSGYLDEVTRVQTMKVVSNLSRTPSEQHHALVAIRTMMNWCVEVGLIESSPVPRIKLKTKSRERVLNDKELFSVYRRALETPYPYGSIIQLLILTGQRRGEIAALRRSWISDEILTFPAGFTKNKREHRLPLSSMALKIIDGLPDTGDLLFPARGKPEKPFNGWGRCKARFDAYLPFSDYTLHDLRRTFSSNLARLSVPIHVTEKILNHASGSIGGIVAVYNRYTYFEEMQDALASHENFLQRCFSAQPEKS